jgi:acetylornithine deacetylase/succinyl-diaminopimelate desuccinylase-like protein
MGYLAATLYLAVEIQQIPAPTFQEEQRARFVAERMCAAGLREVSRDAAGNVYACLPGRNPAARPLVVSAHLDTVFPSETDLTLQRLPDRLCGPGIGDNSLGVAGLFGLVWALAEQGISLPGDLWLAANVGEEGLGDLRGMRAVVERFGERPAAYIALEGLALGQVYHRGLGVRRYRITCRGAGGHSWVDYGRPSAVHALAGLAARLAAFDLPAAPRTTLNIGVFHGGTSVNTIAAEASLELDLRSEQTAALERLARQVQTLAQGCAAPGLSVEIEQVGDRPSGELPVDHPLVGLACAALRRQGLQPVLNIGSTDANLPLSRGLPALSLGLTNGGGAHTTAEYALTAPLAAGMAALVETVRGVWEF